MKKILILLSSILIVGCSEQLSQTSSNQPPFGGPDDLQFASNLWKKAQANNYVGRNSLRTTLYKGTPPHGMVLALHEKENVKIQGEKGVLIVKKNYGGKTASGSPITVSDVEKNPDQYLKAVTIMFKRKAGYDPENKDWFYTKFSPTGAVLTNPKGMQLAGRVAKGADKGCIACHRAAPGGDFVFKEGIYQ